MPASARKLARFDLLVLTALAAAVRLGYAAWLAVPPFDPWRHLLLIAGADGFSLFAGQPYVWYAPLWHPLAGLFPDALGPAFPSVVFGALVPPLWYLVVRATAAGCEDARRPALVAALALAVFGPAVRFTVHYGPEAFALALVAGGLALHGTGRGGAALRSTVGGCLVGLGALLRLNLGPLALLALPLARSRRAAALFSSGVALPLVAGWLRNRAILAEHEWVFTWDGLAVRGESFGALAALMPQRHPEIAEALGRMHALIVPLPEWYRDAAGVRWETIAFLLAGLVALVVARRAALTACAAVLVGAFVLLDTTGSSRFFRVWLPLFPVVLTAIALAAERLSTGRRAWLPGAAALALCALLGAPSLVPPAAPPLAHVVPRAGTLDPGATYAVTSGFYHPEALAYAYPDSRFVGLPLRPDALDGFLDDHPAVDAIVLHELSVQPELEREVERRFGPPARRSTNAGGYRHRVFELDRDR